MFTVLREKGEEIVFGLNNLGNTCYLNATVQCLGSVKELRESLKEYAQNHPSDAYSLDLSKKLAIAWGNTYKVLDTAIEPITPIQLTYLPQLLKPPLLKRGGFNNFKKLKN